jgi:hypothetical protein
MPTYRLRIGLCTDAGRAVAEVIGDLLGLAPLATLGMEPIARAPDLDDGVNPAFRLKLSLSFSTEEPCVQEAQVPVDRVDYGPA